MRVKRICDNLKKVHSKYLKSENKNTFLTRLPTYGRFQGIMEDVDNLTLEELGIEGADDPYYFRSKDKKKYKEAEKYSSDEEQTFKQAVKSPRIKATEILECDDYAVLMIFLKKGACIPLHDHQDMIFYSRVLTGSIRYRAMDKVNINEHLKDELSVFMYYQEIKSTLTQLQVDSRFFQDSQFLQVTVDKIMHANDTKMTLPYQSRLLGFNFGLDNIHTWIAETDSSFIDIILPNYDMKYRRCDYFKEVGGHHAQVGEKTKLYFRYVDSCFEPDRFNASFM